MCNKLLVRTRENDDFSNYTNYTNFALKWRNVCSSYLLFVIWKTSVGDAAAIATFQRKKQL